MGNSNITFAFQYWNGGVSALYTGADAASFVAQHYSPDNGTFASICYGSNPLISDAYVAALDGLYLHGDGGGDIYYDFGDGGVVTISSFV